jgi:hypothetical protein
MQRRTNNSNPRNFRNKGPARRQNTNQVKQEIGFVSTKQNNKTVRSKIMPETRIIKLKFQADFVLLNNAGNSYAAKMFVANGLYDPDPALLTSSVAGYADNMRFYYYCLPTHATYRTVFSNLETFPVHVNTLVSITDTSSLFSSTQNIIDLGENSISSQWTMLSGSSGQNRSAQTLRVNFARMNGNELEYYGGASNYSCTPTTNAPYPFFYSLLAHANNNFSSGIGVSVTIEWTCKLWARNIILDSGPSVSKATLERRLLAKEQKLEDVKGRIEYLKDFEQVDDNDLIVKKLKVRVQDLESYIEELKSTLDDPYKKSSVFSKENEIEKPSVVILNPSSTIEEDIKDFM